MATAQGVAVIWGIPAARSAGTGFTTISSKAGFEGEGKELKSESGETTTFIHLDHKQTLDLEVYPSGGSPGVVPAFGDVVTVNSVKWICMSAEESNTQDGEQKISMKLKRWGTNITIA